MLIDMDGIMRTEAQVRASKINGALSEGPVTAAGKLSSAANGIVHGLETRAALMPGESIETYRANLDAWSVTLSPRTPGEAQVVSRIADISFRRVRLERLEEKLTVAAVELKLATSEPSLAIRKATEAMEGLEGLLALAENVFGPVDGDDVAKLLPAVRAVAKLVQEAEVPVPSVARLDKAIDGLAASNVSMVEPSTFATLAGAVREVRGALQTIMASAQQRLEVERDHIAETAALIDSSELVVVERHRARLARAFDAELRALKLLRELSRDSDSVGSLVQPFLVEVRVLAQRSVA